MLTSLNLPSVKRLPLLVFVNKGIEMGTNKLPLEVIAEAANDEIARVSTFLVRPFLRPRLHASDARCRSLVLHLQKRL